MMPGTRTIIDMAGRTVTIPQTIESFGYPYPLNTLDFIALGVGHKIKVIPEGVRQSYGWDWDKQHLRHLGYSDVVKAVPVSKGSTINSEALLKAKPQVVFLDVSNTIGIRRVTELGMPVVAVDFHQSTLTGLADYMVWLGNIFGGEAPRKAATYKTYVNNALKKLQPVISDVPMGKRPTELFIWDGWSAKGSFLGISSNLMSDSVRAAGGRPLLEGHNSETISKEQILYWNPDVILLQTANQSAFDAFKKDDALRTLKPVKIGKVYPYVTNAGIENILLSLYMAKLFYPERCSSLNVANEIINFHKTIYGVTPTEEDVRTYFTGY
jgi:iron complex transport system substrate-binding protein